MKYKHKEQSEVQRFVKLAKDLGYSNHNLEFRIGSIKLYSLESFLKPFVRDSKELIRYAKKLYVPQDFNFEKWLTETEVRDFLKCNKIPDMGILYKRYVYIGSMKFIEQFIIPLETKRITPKLIKLQIMPYYVCAMEFNAVTDPAKSTQLKIIVVSYFSKSDKTDESLKYFMDEIEILRTNKKLDVKLLKSINKIGKIMIKNPQKIPKTLSKEINHAKNKIEKLIILGVTLFIGTKMPEVVSNMDVVKTTTKAVIDELMRIPEDELLDAVDSVPIEIVSYLPPRIIPYLNEKQIQHLTPKQLKYLTPEQLKYLTPEQIRHLTPEQLNNLTIEQILAIIKALPTRMDKIPPEKQEKIRKIIEAALEHFK